uniref:Uncharacterized protein n=1 Tax=Arundo donax TaxID=35708 RepID=A0A0A8ZN94_ARUDO
MQKKASRGCWSTSSCPTRAWTTTCSTEPILLFPGD